MVEDFFNVSQPFERRAQKGDQVGHEHVVGVQVAIAVGRPPMQLLQPVRTVV
jgi:hypothetical protein